jgi:hypothetical protein
MGEEKGVDNIAACSTNNGLDIEECSGEDHFDKCIVFQAFSLSKNTTIFKRECTTERFCEERKICSDPDFSDCRYECCAGDLCNSFDFTDNVNTSVPEPTVAMTTQKHQGVVDGSVERVVTETTVVPEITTQGATPTTRQPLKSNKDQGELKFYFYQITLKGR